MDCAWMRCLSLGITTRSESEQDVFAISSLAELGLDARGGQGGRHLGLGYVVSHIGMADGVE